ncbi:hypothetical protein ACHWGL_29905, partial [Klebsiella pneumoniae]|uniref:hypothetical protein n=1 Tax=Klebsiella pneumoniae TaxID=573 RepID=UPI00376ECBF6
TPGTPEYRRRVNAMARGMVEEVRRVLRRAQAGDKNAQNILAQASWYKAMRRRLRQEFGGVFLEGFLEPGVVRSGVALQCRGPALVQPVPQLAQFVGGRPVHPPPSRDHQLKQWQLEHDRQSRAVARLQR